MASLNTRIIGNSTEVDGMLNNYFVPFPHEGFIEIGDESYCMPVSYRKWAEKIKNFEVRNDDTFVMGFPRSGTTWTEEMVWLIVNNLDFEGAKKLSSKRVPLLELDAIYVKMVPASNGIDDLTYASQLSSPRCFKTHLPWPLLPKEITNGSKTPKIIYVLRNPKDVCVSYCNLHRLFYGFKGPLEDFCKLFLANRVTYGPFWVSVKSFWRQRHLPNILFIKYKDMTEDLKSVIKQVANFLGKQLDERQIPHLQEHLNIESMRKNSACNREKAIEYAKSSNRMVCDENIFIGKGVQNGYLSVMSPELVLKFDEWTHKHVEGTDLKED